MELEEFIQSLETLNAPDRKADQGIARLCGYHSSVEDGRNVWRLGKSPNPVRVPEFTSNIDRAIQFAQQAIPNHAAAFAFVGGEWKAKIEDDGEVVRSSNPALSVCIATLKHLARHQ